MATKSLLILIDLQQGWRHKTATESTMLRCVELAQEFTGDVFHCCFKNKQNSLFETELNWTRFRNSEDTQQIPEVAPLNLPVYWRSTYSCLTDEIRPIVAQYDRVYLAGVFTDASVYMTALDLFDAGIPVSVIRDCVATLHGESIHASALRALEHILNRKNVLYSDELPGSLLAEPSENN